MVKLSPVRQILEDLPEREFIDTQILIINDYCHNCQYIDDCPSNIHTTWTETHYRSRSSFSLSHSSCPIPMKMKCCCSILLGFGIVLLLTTKCLCRKRADPFIGITTTTDKLIKRWILPFLHDKNKNTITHQRVL